MPGQLAEMKKLYWVAKPRKVVAKIAERLKMRSSRNFAKVLKLINNKKILPYHKRTDI